MTKKNLEVINSQCGRLTIVLPIRFCAKMNLNDNLAASKIAILKGLESLEIEFVIFQVRKNSQICQKSNVRATKTVKNAKFEVLNGMKLISHKI